MSKSIYITIFPIFLICVCSQLNPIRSSLSKYPFESNETIVCNQTQPIQYSIKFSSIPRKPQVILNLWKIKMDKGISEVQASISHIKQSQFQVNIGCKSGVLELFSFRWFVVDDQRIQVLDSFNMTNLTKKTFKHQNPNALTAFVIITSIGFTGKFDFFLKILEINQTTVTVDIQGNYANVSQLGYQIILGIQEAFIMVNQSYFNKSFKSQDFTLASTITKILAINFYGLNYSKDVNFDFQGADGPKNTTQEYRYYVYPNGGGSYNNIFWIMRNITTVFSPLKLQNLSIKNQKYINETFQTSIALFIYQTNLELTSTRTFQAIIEKQFKKIKILVSIKCQENFGIQSQFYKYSNRTLQKKFNFIHFCDSQIRQMIYEVQYQTIDDAHQELEIRIQGSNCSVFQILYNQVKVQKILFQISIND
ncbi:unnamed protein product [Paramecium primaurelia]|uniref:H-type lectin domain-containing protein n=1 Tax=Paramecium primaurelia TaxID=5886 RepID=A0A8S1JPN1_PARPR|nr:unnamed protein product [Paramecium primaurelia]